MNKRIFLSPPWMGGSELLLIKEAFDSNYIAPCGPMVDRFERAFAGTVGLPHACAVSSGTAALELLFHELRIGAGDTVFCSDLTFVSSVGPAVHRGAAPVFIDCDEATWTMNPDLLEEALADAAQAGRLPKAVVAVDLYGQCCDYERIEVACGRYEIPLIIDAAEALGAGYSGRGRNFDRMNVVDMGGENALTGAQRTQRREAVGKRPSVIGNKRLAVGDSPADGLASSLPQGRQAGDAGWAAIYSFNGNKIITTSGGGMLASRDEGVIARARKRAQQSREPVVWYEHKEVGYNHRMSNIVAAIGVGQLQHLEEIVSKKRQLFEWYREKLGERVSFMPEASYGRCTRWLTVIEVRSEALGVRRLKTGNGKRETGGEPSTTVERLRQALEAENIESRPMWKPMHLQPVFRGTKVYGGSVSERLFSNGLCLPSGTGLIAEDVERVCGIVKGVFQ